MSEAAYGIDIVGNNRTDAGARGAERRLGQIPRHVSQVSRRFERERTASLRRHARSTIRTFGEVEQAGARIFGGSSMLGGVTSRLGGVTAGARALGTGLGEAAAGGGLLSSSLGVIGVAAGATVGILAAAGYAAFKLADGWAKGAAAIGRTSEIIGVGTKQMQEFSAAAERAGVDKDKATGTLGSLSQTLNDARYGRNSGALEVLTRLGVGMKLNGDGTVNVGAMLPAIADAMSRQNSSGRRTAASALGISLDALPVFTQGGKALSADMVDADKHAPMISDAEVEIGKRIVRKGAMVGQLKDRALDRAGKVTAETAEVGYDAVLSGGQAIMDGASDFKGTVERTFKPAAEKIERAADRIGTAIRGGSVSVMREAIGAAHRTERKWGIPASVQLGQFGLESSFGKKMPRGSNNPFGIKARKGEPFVWAMTTEVINGRKVRLPQKFRKFDSLDQSFDAHGRLLAQGRYTRKARQHGYDIDRFVEALGHGTRADPRYATDQDYGAKMRGVIGKNHLRQYDHGGGAESIPVKVEIEMRGAPPGTRAKATAGRSSRPAVSHAMER